MKKKTFFIIVSILVLLSSSQAEERIPAPDKFLGFKVGQDFKLANWSQILEYFEILDKASPRVKVLQLGQSTLGRKFVIVIITSSSNMESLDKIRQIQKRLHDPRKLQAEEEERLVKEGKPIVFISCSIHSTEIAASQMSMELAYKLAAGENREIKNILENTVLLLIPSVNPDGIDMVFNWYRKYMGTPYESSPMPWLYHHYVGHDNNRDWFMLTQKETQLVTRVLYHDWFPLLVYDVHQMGSLGPRFFIPPYYDPINPNIDPLLIREINLLAGEAALNLTKEGKTGVATGAIFDAWYNLANRASPLRHNVIGILSEAASARIASPVFIKKSEIRMFGRGFKGSGIQSSYLEPWPGGWWRLRDIIDYEEITAFTFLKTIAKNREKYLANFSLLARRQIEKGKTEPPSSYLVPREQRDLPTAIKLLKVLQEGGAEVYEAQKPFKADEVLYPDRTFIIPLAQPYRAFIKDLMEMKSYPVYTSAKGVPELPYDEASWTLPLQMGVKTIEVTNPFQAEMKLLSEVEFPTTRVKGKGSKYYIFSSQYNNSSILLNRLFKKKVNLKYSRNVFSFENQTFPPGTILVPGQSITLSELNKLSKDLGLSIYRADRKPAAELKSLLPPRIGIYQSWIPNMDEGWLRWTLEQFEFPFKVLHNEEIKAGNLTRTYTHIIIPSMSQSVLLKGRKEGEVPPQYAGGIGKEGVGSLEDFVLNGGRLITIGRSTEFAIKFLGLPVKNIVDTQFLRRRYQEPKPEKEQSERIYCPGSMLKVEIDNSHPIGFGLGKKGVVFSYFSPVFDVEKATVIASYPQYNPLLSGILINGDKIIGKAAAVECQQGKGKVILFGFKVIHRAQAHGTFKFLFNSLLYD